MSHDAPCVRATARHAFARRPAAMCACNSPAVMRSDCHGWPRQLLLKQVPAPLCHGRAAAHVDLMRQGSRQLQGLLHPHHQVVCASHARTSCALPTTIVGLNSWPRLSQCIGCTRLPILRAGLYGLCIRGAACVAGGGAARPCTQCCVCAHTEHSSCSLVGPAGTMG